MADTKISALTAKATPVAADIVPILDSEDGNSNKRTTVGALGAGGMLGMQVFTTSGTYTPTSGTSKCHVYCTGGGGGGGGVKTSTTGAAAANGGRAGVTAISFLDVADISGDAVTVGSGGAGGSGASEEQGADGGASSVGSDISAPGGAGGQKRVGTGDIFAPNADAPTTGGTGDILLAGEMGSTPTFAEDRQAFGGYGGASFWGSGGAGTRAENGGSNGAAGVNYGSGGAGGSVDDATGNANGGNGAGGIVVIYEFG